MSDAHPGAERSSTPLARATAAWTALAALSAVGCTRAQPPPTKDSSIASAPLPASTPASSASAAPSAVPSATPSAVPTAAASVNRETCTPRPPAVQFEVKDDDVVIPLDAQGCPLGESHFKANGYSYKASVDFMTQLQRRVSAGDKTGLADLTNYPLRVNFKNRDPLIVKDRAAFLRDFDHLYSPSVAAAILKEDPRDVSCNYQGIMLGRGVLWADNRDGGHYGVIAINPP
jgi:hypothetical protein